MKKSFLTSLATLGPIGYLPASGTCASLVTLPFACLSNQVIVSLRLYFLFVCMCILVSWAIIRASAAYCKGNDPSEIVLDEVIGMLVTFYALPCTLTIAFNAFCLFRFFDITKTMGISYLEKRIPGPWGILIDDIAAGLLANGVMHLSLAILP